MVRSYTRRRTRKNRRRRTKWRRKRTFKKRIQKIVDATKKVKIQIQTAEQADMPTHGYSVFHGTLLYKCDSLNPNPSNFSLEYLRKDMNARILSSYLSGEIRNYAKYPVKVDIFRAQMTKDAIAKALYPSGSSYIPTAVHDFFDRTKVKVTRTHSFTLGAYQNIVNTTLATDTAASSIGFQRSITFGVKFPGLGRFIDFNLTTPTDADYKMMPFIIIRTTRLDDSGFMDDPGDIRFYYKGWTRFVDDERRPKILRFNPK